MKYLLLILVSSFAIAADQFNPLEAAIEKVTCSNQKSRVTIAGIDKPYIIYDGGSSAVKVHFCHKVNVAEKTFYTIQMITENEDGPSLQKIYTFEIALLDQNSQSLKTVRSEVVDHLSLDGEISGTKIKNGLKVDWGKSKTDGRAMLKMEVVGPNIKPFPYFMKLNLKNDWFEDVL